MTKASKQPGPVMVRSCLWVAAIASVAGCGNLITAQTIGYTGVTVTAGGDPVAVIAVCDQSIDSVNVSEGRFGLEEDEPNTPVGDWVNDEEATGLVQVDLVTPEGPWEGPKGVDFDERTLYIVGAYSERRNASAGQVAFYGQELAHMQPENIYANPAVDGGLVATPRATFLRDGCSMVGYGEVVTSPSETRRDQ
ncbi:MAG: hypothetical protein WBG36_16845 [Ornithinimicrobium sp.]